jgi:hypothetical protein
MPSRATLRGRTSRSSFRQSSRNVAYAPGAADRQPRDPARARVFGQQPAELKPVEAGMPHIQIDMLSQKTQAVQYRLSEKLAASRNQPRALTRRLRRGQQGGNVQFRPANLVPPIHQMTRIGEHQELVVRRLRRVCFKGPAKMCQAEFTRTCGRRGGSNPRRVRPCQRREPRSDEECFHRNGFHVTVEQSRDRGMTVELLSRTLKLPRSSPGVWPGRLAYLFPFRIT